MWQSSLSYPLPPIRTKKHHKRSRRQEKSHVAAGFVASSPDHPNNGGAGPEFERGLEHACSAADPDGWRARLSGAWADHAGNLRSGRRPTEDQHGAERHQAGADARVLRGCLPGPLLRRCFPRVRRAGFWRAWILWTLPALLGLQHLWTEL